MMALEQIVHDAPTPRYAVDSDLLHEKTNRVDFDVLLQLHCQELRYLHVLGDNTESDPLRSRTVQPGYYLDDTQSWLLMYCVPAEQILGAIEACGDNLELLDLRFTSITAIDLSHLTGLRELCLERNKSLAHVTGMQCHRKLRELEIRGTSFLTVLDLNGYDELSKIDIFDTQIQEVILDHNLTTENVWLTGARFIQPNTGLSAVVRIDGNVLQIYVRSENDLHSRNTYLSVIEGSVDQIRQELKLPKPRNRLVYKVGNRRAEFDYERLLKMHAKGKETEFSDELDDDFPILDILNQFAPDESTEQERLLADLVKACGQLQAEKHYWGTKENPRNSYIRNALDNMGYVLRDQTLRGISGGETEEGELDLDIRKYKDVPWTICEALRVDSGSKTDWNFHLKKLLDNYNPNGLRFLILLTYVDDEKDKFDQIWNSFKDHIQGHDEGGFTFKLDSFKHYQTESWTGNHFIQTAKCKYVLGEYTPVVYHVFVRMGR